MSVAAGVPRSDPKSGPLVWRSPSRRFLAVLGLSGFAISQPLLSLFGDNPTTIAFYRVDGIALIAFAVLVAFVPPSLLWLIGTLIEWINDTAGRIAHLVTVWLLATAALVQILRAVGMTGALPVLLAPALGVGLTVAYVRVPAVGTWVTYTAVLPFLAVAVFLFTSPASALLQTAGSPDRQDTDAPSVVMIVLDELPTRSLVQPDGNLDAARYPNTAALTDDFTWYRHHTSLAPYTDAAVPSLLTGTTPTTDPPLWTSHPDNLFTMLAPTHRLEVMEAATRLCPYEDCPPATGEQSAALGDLLTRARKVWVDRVSPDGPEPSALDDFAEAVDPADSDSGPSAPATPEGGMIPNDTDMRTTSARADQFRAAFDPAAGSTLYFLHLMLPHQPWRFWPDGEIYGDPDYLSLALPAEDRETSRSWSEWDSVVAEQRHVLQMQYVDGQLGQILGDLKADGLYDSSMVVITSDHGVSFELGTPTRAATDDTLDSIAYAPLFVKLPGQTAGGIDDSNAMAIDVLPTIADALDIEPSWEVDGAPLGSPQQTERGTGKVFHPMAVIDGERDERSVLEYDDDEVWPTVPERHLGPLPNPADPLSALNALLPVQGVIGVPFEQLHPTGDGGSLSLLKLQEVEHPVDAPFGVDGGIVEGVPPEGVVLLVVDGIVVAGSEVSTDSEGNDRVTFMIPQGTLDEDNDVSGAVMVDGQTRMLTLKGM